jgi:hypothetical protein
MANIKVKKLGVIPKMRENQPKAFARNIKCLYGKLKNLICKLHKVNCNKFCGIYCYWECQRQRFEQYTQHKMFMLLGIA